jgi:hypothetical protein
MPEGDWFEVTIGERLLQGDILLGSPTFGVARDLQWPLPAGAEIGLNVSVYDVVVMTQSCDLDNEKVEDVLLARLVSWPDVVRAEAQRGNALVQGSKFRKLLIEGNVPGLSLLHKRDEAPALPWSVVDFRQLFTLPKAFLQQLAATGGSRLRLRSPYREHLAQAFARYFMRVGLPHDARAFEKDGEVKL